MVLPANPAQPLPDTAALHRTDLPLAPRSYFVTYSGITHYLV